MVSGQPFQPMTPDRARPIVLEMTEPVGCLHERWPLTYRNISDADAVLRLTEVDMLFRDLVQGVRSNLSELLKGHLNPAQGTGLPYLDLFLSCTPIEFNYLIKDRDPLRAHE